MTAFLASSEDFAPVHTILPEAENQRSCLRKLKPENQSRKLVGVVLDICEGTSDLVEINRLVYAC